jgi:hypothetical protein
LSESEDTVHDGTETYHVGIIDILQRYTTFKKFEASWKGLLISPEAVSCADPYAYHNRFLRRISSHLLGHEAIDANVDEDDLASTKTKVSKRTTSSSSTATQKQISRRN